jgi:uncharacterized protein (TIGR02265 family)
VLPATSSVPPPFVRPNFDHELDSKPYLDRVPEGTCCKGMFFNDIINNVRRMSPGAEKLLPGASRRYVPFRDYPLREHMGLTAAAVPLLFPRMLSREGMRRLGWLSYPTFAESMVGRVVFGILGNDLEQIFSVGPRAFPISVNRGRATAERLGSNHFRYVFRDFFGYLDTYYVGVIEGPILHHKRVPDVRLHLETLSDGIMDIRWR